MLTQLRIQNFKSWRDTGPMRFAPLTGFFGANSSGKTSILQLLLLLKQTAASSDRAQVLFLGDQNSYVNFVTFRDIIFRHQAPSRLEFALRWTPELPFGAQQNGAAPEPLKDEIFFQAAIGQDQSDVTVLRRFVYKFATHYFGIERDSTFPQHYKLINGNDSTALSMEKAFSFAPIKCYGFPYEVRQQRADYSRYYDYLQYNFESLFQKVLYLGPLRDYPKPDYYWGGSAVTDVGIRGESTISALLYTQKLAQSAQQNTLDWATVQGWPDTERYVAYWLKELNLIHSFALRPANRQRFEVRIQQTENSPEVALTEVGFGVSQILPILTLCYYAPPGSTLVLEQPEIHLHPAIQSGLADVFIDVIKKRNVQIILESHSEHLLRRLQRRMAEADQQQFTPADVALYFTRIEDGESRLEELQLDEYGSISNWPQNFFGDEMGDLVAMMRATMRRQGVPEE